MNFNENYRTINWLLQTNSQNRNNSYASSLTSLRYSLSSSSLNSLEQQQKQINNDNDSISSLSTTIIIERNQQVLSNTICNTDDMLDEHIHNLIQLKHELLPRIHNKRSKYLIKQNLNKISLFSKRFYSIILHYILPIIIKSFFLV